MNPKTLQKIMEHSNIGVTLNTYTHLDFGKVGHKMLGTLINTTVSNTKEGKNFLVVMDY